MTIFEACATQICAHGIETISAGASRHALAVGAEMDRNLAETSSIEQKEH